MSRTLPTLETIVAGRRRFIRLSGSLMTLSALGLVGCGGSSTGDSNGAGSSGTTSTTPPTLGANTTAAKGQIKLPSGAGASPGALRVVNVYSQVGVTSDLSFNQTVIASSPSLVSVIDADNNVILMGYLDPTVSSNVLDALSSAVVLLYFAFDFQAFPEENRQQLLGLLAQNAATVTLSDVISQRLQANPLALSQGDSQISAAVLVAYNAITASGSATQTANTAPAVSHDDPVAHDAPAANPLLLIQPSASTQQSGFSVAQLSTGAVGFTGTNYYRREVALYVYKIATGTPDPTTGIVPPLDEAQQIGTKVIVPPTQKLSIFNAVTDVIYGTAPYTPVTTNAITLSLDSGSKSTVYGIVALGGGTQVRTAPPYGTTPAFFSQAIYAGEVSEWSTEAKALLLKTWLIDVFIGTVLELAGTPTLLSISLDAAADSLLEISDPTWQAAIDEFLEGNTPGAMVSMFTALTASPALQEEVFTIVVSVIQGAAGGVFLNSLTGVETAASTFEAPQYLLTEVGHVILGVLEGLNIAFVAADVLAVSHDLANSNIAELWTATLTAPTIALNPATASIQPGQNVTFTAKLPTGEVPPAGSTIEYDWTQTGTFSSLSDGGTGTGQASLNTAQSVVTLITTPSEQATSITVGVTVYFVDGSGTKTLVGAAASATVTLSATGAVNGLIVKLATCTQLINMPASANGLIPARTVYYIWVIPYYTFATQSGATYYSFTNAEVTSDTYFIYADRFYPASAPTVSEVSVYDIATLPTIADVLGFPDSPDQPASPTSTSGSYQPVLLAPFESGPVTFGGGVIGIPSAARILLPGSAAGSYGTSYLMQTIDPYADSQTGGSGAEPTTAQLNAEIASLQASALQQMAQVPAYMLPKLTIT